MYIKDGFGMKPVEEKDLEFLKQLRNSQSTWSNLTSVDMLTSHGQLEWLHKFSKDPTKKYFITFDQSPERRVGFIRCDEIDYPNRSMRVGADVALSERGKGFGTATYILLLDYCFNYLNMNRLWLLVLDTNNIAKKLYEKVGFKTEGCMRQAILRNNQYVDYILMSILKEEYFNENSISSNAFSL